MPLVDALPGLEAQHSALLLSAACTHSKRLAKMISTMRERMSAKLGNNNDNAFRMRKLFKMYDKTDSGLVRQCTGLGSCQQCCDTSTCMCTLGRFGCHLSTPSVLIVQQWQCMPLPTAS